MPLPITFHGWIAAQAIPLALLAGFLACGVLIVAISAWNRRHHLQRVRAGESIDTFAERLRFQGFDPELSRRVYTYLTEHEKVGFPVRARDMLEEDLGMSSQDVQQMVQFILNETGRTASPTVSDTPLYTVGDVIRAVQLAPFADRMAA